LPSLSDSDDVIILRAVITTVIPAQAGIQQPEVL